MSTKSFLRVEICLIRFSCMVELSVPNLAVATKASSVSRSPKLRHVDLGYSTWMGDHEGIPHAVNMCPIVCVDLNL